MMKKLSLITLLFVFFLCNAQQTNLEKISIHFAMFKHPNVTYTIDFKKNEMTCVMLKFGNDGDVVFNKKYVFSDKQATKLLSEMKKDVPVNDLRISNSALDGGGFTLTYFKESSKTSKLVITNARLDEERFKKPLQKIDAFFKFAYSITRDPESLQLLDASYSPYYVGLPIRKSFNSPLEYKIWGNISGGEAGNEELFKFLDNLPRDKCVIIDCNYNLSWALQDAVLKRYIIKYSNLKFINNDYLEYTRENLFKVRSQIKSEKDFEKDTAYDLYMSDPKGMDKWLAQPDGQWNMTMRTALKNCQ